MICGRCGRPIGLPEYHEFCEPEKPKQKEPKPAPQKDYTDYVMEAKKHILNIVKRHGAPKTAKPPMPVTRYNGLRIDRRNKNASR